MNKDFVFYLCLALSLIACRQDEVAGTEPMEKPKIIYFENYSKNINTQYSEPYLNYKDASNPAVPFAQTLKTYLKDHPDLEKRILEKYGEISFNVSSQLIENEETGQIGVFFPIKKGRKYTGVVFAVVNKSHTYFFFNVYGEEIEEIKSVLNIFDKNVAKYQLNKVCGDEDNECYINEVELIRYRPDREQNRNTHTIWNDSGFSIFSGAIGEPTINFGGGGGRGHRPKNTPPNNDPCGNAISRNNESQGILNSKKVSDAKREATKTLNSDTNEKVFTFGKDATGNYRTSEVKEGVNGMTAPYSPFHSDFTVTGSGHTHTVDLYSSHSVGDIYNLYKANNANPNFTRDFAFAVDATYVLTIIDREKFRRFVEKYPQDKYFDIERVDWTIDTPIKEDFDAIHEQFINSGFSDKVAYAYATAAILKQYDTGVILSVQEKGIGNFKTIYTEGKVIRSSALSTPISNHKKVEDCNL